MIRPYSEATRRLVADVLMSRQPVAWTYAMQDAAALLDALAKAGLLLPEGAETRTEYGVDCEGNVCAGDSYSCARRHYTGGSVVRAQRIARSTRGVVEQRSVGPWLAVGDNKDSDLDSVPVEETTQ